MPGEIDLLGTLLAHWRVFGVLMAACVLVAAVIFFLRVPTYSTEVTILPRGGSGGSGILGRLAGVSDLMPDTDANLEELYGKIVISDTILDSLVVLPWRASAGGPALSLAELLVLSDEGTADPDQQMIRVKNRLRSEIIRFHRDFQSGFMVLTVRVKKYPLLAQDLANRIADQLNLFNITFRTRKSSEKRKFIECRLQEVQESLNRATQKMADFQERNRNFGSSPFLQLEYGDLEREVRAQEAIWVELKRQLEMVKIDESRQTLAVDVLDRATLPSGPAGPGLVMYLFFGAVIGFLMALLVLGFRWLVAQVSFRLSTGSPETRT